ncbi:STM3941 family protein [Brachyspira alvinipulli]|uniref:STM3941 family protein n=1 Tax=Brachyspira alvinipulli TaxID=84379 RepID=UPI00047FF3A6|nr:STM3941 family protein [Brachyspira alvinipulli]
MNNDLLNNDELPEMQIYNSKRKLFFMAFLSLIFISISILIFINNNGYKEIIISIVISIFFGICFLVCILQLLKSGKPIITLDKNGIKYYVLLRNKNIFIKWTEIKEIYFSKTFIYIYLKEESSLLENKKNKNEPMVLYMSELKMKKDNVIALITYYFEINTGII